MDTEEIKGNVRDIIHFFNGLDKSNNALRRKSLGTKEKKVIKIDINKLERQLGDIKEDLITYQTYEQKRHQHVQASVFNVIVELIHVVDENLFTKRDELTKEAHKILKELNQLLPESVEEKMGFRARKMLYETNVQNLNRSTHGNRIEEKLTNIELKINQYLIYDKQTHELYQNKLFELQSEVKKNGINQILRQKIFKKISILNNHLNEKLPKKSLPNEEDNLDVQFNAIDNELTKIENGVKEGTDFDEKAIKQYSENLNKLQQELENKKGISKVRLIGRVLKLQSIVQQIEAERKYVNKKYFDISVKRLKGIFEKTSGDEIPYTSSNLSQIRIKQANNGKYIQNIRKFKSTNNLMDKEYDVD